MSEEKKDHKIQIWIAIIGFVGVIGAAIISNWDKLISNEYASTGTRQASKKIDSKNHDLSALTMIPISYKGKNKYLEIISDRTASYNKNTLTFKAWGFVSSKEKIISANSSNLSFKLRFSTDALRDNQGEIWKPKLYVIFSESRVNKENMYSLQGINIIFPSEEEISIKSKYGSSITSEYRGDKLINPSVWHDINITLNNESIKVKVDNTIVIDSDLIVYSKDYFLILKSWSSADFQIKDLVMK